MIFLRSILILLYGCALFGGSFTEVTDGINGYKFFAIEGMIAGHGGNGYIDEDTISSLEDLKDELTELNNIKEKWVIVIDNRGGRIGLESPFVNAIIDIANRYYEIKKEKLNIAISLNCDSLCGIAFIELRHKIKKMNLSKKVQIKVSMSAVFGFHGAITNDKFNEDKSILMQKKMIAFGINKAWLEKNINFFKSTEIHFVSAVDLVNESSGWVLSSEIY